MTIPAIAHDREQLDALVWRATGRSAASAVERTLEANPGLAERSLALEEGTPVPIPDSAAAPAEPARVTLWT